MPLHQQSRVRGVKRKRPEEDKETKLRQKLARLSVRELCQVAKKVRAFEIQKTLKKLQDARRKDSEGDMTKDLAAQMEILKHLDYDRLAHSALVTKLKKDKTLAADPIIQAISVELAAKLASPATLGTPMAKVQSRILSSKVLASEVTSMVETLKALLHPPVGPKGIGLQAASDAPFLPSCMPKKRRTGSGDQKEAFTKDDVADLSDEGSDVSENTSGDEADDGWESGMVDTPSESGASVADNDDTSPEGFSEASFPSKGLKSQNPRFHGRSEFLPSLLVGFARGDSGSEFSDSEAKSVDGMKKNRRGQRARRTMWEKKFGKNANHIKKRLQQQHLQAGSAPVDRRSGKGNTFRRTPTRSRALSRRREQDSRSKPEKSGGIGLGRLSDRKDGHRVRQRERPLHPSWEARKKKPATIVPSQGTKVVFSEPS